MRYWFKRCENCNKRQWYLDDQWKVYIPRLHVHAKPKKLLCKRCIKAVQKAMERHA